MAATDLSLEMGDGGGADRYNTIKIGPDGRCQYVFFDRVQITRPDGGIAFEQRGRRTEFVIGPEVLADLRKLLVEIDFFRLKKAYYADAHDGTQRWAKLEVSGERKSVYCNNHFPPAFQKLYSFVWDKIIGSHNKELQNAQVIDLKNDDAGYESFK
jgi:hypothetical protein